MEDFLKFRKMVTPIIIQILVLFSINDTLTEIKNKMRDTIG
jgi:hypothetical protein